MPKRIMLLGASGQIGQALQHESLPDNWELGCYGHADLDITNHHRSQQIIDDYKPDLIINAAAMTAVDQCETDHETAKAANFYAVANLAAQCSARDVPLIHLSTDYVFDGEGQTTPYLPDDVMHPLNYYGDSKMMGEEALRHELAWHVILRVSAVFSAYGGNILTRLLRMIDERDELKMATDQKSSPTYAPDLAKALLAMAAAILKGKHNGFGTFHYCGEPPANRLEFAQAVMEAYAPYTSRRPRITPVLTKDLATDLPNHAPRPAYSVLDCAKIRDIYGIAQKPWRDGLTEAVAALARDRG